MRKTTPQTRGENGQSLMELAISLMFIMVLLAGGIDLGRAFFTYSALRDAAQEGAAFASIAPTDANGNMNEEAIRVRALTASNPDSSWTYNSNLNLPRLWLEGHIEVETVFFGERCLGNAVRVTVTYTDFPLSMLAMVLGTNQIPIRATITDTVLQPACGG